jgi:hypothetical protein
MEMHPFIVLIYLICHIYFHYLNFIRNKIIISLKNFGFTPVHTTTGSPVLLSLLFYLISSSLDVYPYCHLFSMKLNELFCLWKWMRLRFGVFSSCGSRLSSFHERQQVISVALRYTLHGALLKAKRRSCCFTCCSHSLRQLSGQANRFYLQPSRKVIYCSCDTLLSLLIIRKVAYIHPVTIVILLVWFVLCGLTNI